MPNEMNDPKPGRCMETKPANATRPAWYWLCAEFGKSNLRKSVWQILNTLGPYLLLWALMILATRLGYPYWVTLVLAVFAAGFLVRVFILFHDCCHGSFFASPWANTALGYIAGVLTF